MRKKSFVVLHLTLYFRQEGTKCVSSFNQYSLQNKQNTPKINFEIEKYSEKAQKMDSFFIEKECKRILPNNFY